MTDLRARQRALATAAILEALAELVSERRHLDFSLQEVADLAGVSLRTVYNHFPSREALLDGLAGLFNETLRREGGVDIGDIDHVNGLLHGVDVNFRLFSRFDALSEAFVQIGGGAQRGEDHTSRTGRMVELVADFLGDEVADADGQLVGLVVRHLSSQLTWWAMTRDYRLDDDDTVRAVRWAVGALLRAARDGDVPSGVDPGATVDGSDRSGIVIRAVQEES